MSITASFHVFQILSVSAIVLANLCVSYIMTSANEEVSTVVFVFYQVIIVDKSVLSCT